MVPLAIGSDALGSIRLPASLCGVFGLRPTRGTVSDNGVLGAGKTISTVGPMARHAYDVELCLRAWRGAEGANDAPHRDAPAPKGSTLRYAKGMGYFSEGLDADAAEAVRCIVDALGAVREIEFPQPARARAAATLVNATESAIGRLELLRTRAQDFDRSTRDRFLAHALLPAQWYLHAQRYRRWHIAQVVAMFADIDVLIVPATPCVRRRSARRRCSWAARRFRRGRRSDGLRSRSQGPIARRSPFQSRAATGCRSASSSSRRRIASTCCCRPPRASKPAARSAH